jgi:hypothetical protein
MRMLRINHTIILGICFWCSFDSNSILFAPVGNWPNALAIFYNRLIPSYLVRLHLVAPKGKLVFLGLA